MPPRPHHGPRHGGGGHHRPRFRGGFGPGWNLGPAWGPSYYDAPYPTTPDVILVDEEGEEIVPVYEKKHPKPAKKSPGAIGAFENVPGVGLVALGLGVAWLLWGRRGRRGVRK